MSLSSNSSNDLKRRVSGHSSDASDTTPPIREIAFEIVNQYHHSRGSQAANEARALSELIRRQILMMNQMMIMQMQNHDRMMRLAQQFPDEEKHRYIEKFLDKFLEKDDSDDDDDEIDVDDSG